MRNMKIPVEINEQGESTLDEIVATLEGQGYKCDGYHPYYCNYVVCCDDGTYCMYTLDIGRDEEYKLTTLAELRSMNIETLKEV